MSKAALGFFASTALLAYSHQGKAAPQTAQAFNTLRLQVDCYGNCYNGMTGYDSDSPRVRAKYYHYGSCGPETEVGKPPCPKDLLNLGEGCIGTINLFWLYDALIAGRPDVYPFTYARDRWGIPTVSTPYSLNNLKAIIDEARKIGPPRAYSEADALFINFVRTKIEMNSILSAVPEVKQGHCR